MENYKEAQGRKQSLFAVTDFQKGQCKLYGIFIQIRQVPPLSTPHP